MPDRRRSEFELRVLPHLGAAYSLARWLLRHPQDAEDAVQDSLVRAFRAYDAHVGASTAAWLLAIVRNTCLTALERRRAERNVVLLEDLPQALDRLPVGVRPEAPPGADEAMIAEERRRKVHRAVASLPVQFREVLVLREFHDLSYREIADIVGTPVGTVMSRLARAREHMRRALVAGQRSEDEGEAAS
jgi:RNA polymerase sigma-70 factor (ECF subfamily)